MNEISHIFKGFFSNQIMIFSYILVARHNHIDFLCSHFYTNLYISL